ncbi:hypothetical protein BTVI_99340 [Pitangus sulphuratus]|nr:hypothetical protein BTVI_99340 [Pitangus sulphuratus]
MIGWTEYVSYEERLKGLGLFSPVQEKRRLNSDLTVPFLYLKEAYKKDGECLLTRARSNRTRRNGFKVREREVAGNIKRKTVMYDDFLFTCLCKACWDTSSSRDIISFAIMEETC